MGDLNTLKEILCGTERASIKSALEISGGNRTKAAILLGITRPSLYNKMKKHGLN
jgi:transcriptional regulator with PAS, ATPase and Fis domain